MTRRVTVLGDHADVVMVALEAAGLALARHQAPDLVFCHGGDGTLLRAERMFPGIPKVPARVGLRSRLCAEHGLEAIVDRLARNLLADEELPKLELRVGAFRAWAVNDVVMRNGNPAVAVRYRVTVGAETSAEISGDGLVIATSFGSTAYFRSITAGSIAEGLGVAFNNSTSPRPPLNVAPDQTIGVELVRGPAVLVCDNDPRSIPMRASHLFEVSQSDRRAVVLGLDALRCQTCRRDDGAAFNAH